VHPRYRCVAAGGAGLQPRWRRGTVAPEGLPPGAV